MTLLKLHLHYCLFYSCINSHEGICTIYCGSLHFHFLWWSGSWIKPTLCFIKERELIHCWKGPPSVVSLRKNIPWLFLLFLLLELANWGMLKASVFTKEFFVHCPLSFNNSKSRIRWWHFNVLIAQLIKTNDWFAKTASTASKLLWKKKWELFK